MRSHAALGASEATDARDDSGRPRCFVEADIGMVDAVPTNDPQCPGCIAAILRVRRHSLFVPRDFDVSPSFEIVEPTAVAGPFTCERDRDDRRPDPCRRLS